MLAFDSDVYLSIPEVSTADSDIKSKDSFELGFQISSVQTFVPDGLDLGTNTQRSSNFIGINNKNNFHDYEHVSNNNVIKVNRHVTDDEVFTLDHISPKQDCPSEHDFVNGQRCYSPFEYCDSNDLTMSPSSPNFVHMHINSNQDCVNSEHHVFSLKKTDKLNSQEGKSSCIRSKKYWGDSNSKNAIAARDNRLKKKQYITGLEESLRSLQYENKRLSEETKKNKKLMKCLKREVSYLKGIIANQSTLAAVLKNVSKTPGIKLSSSLVEMVELKKASAQCNEKIISIKPTRNLQSQTFYETEKTTSDQDSFINVEDTDTDSESELEFSEYQAGICVHVSGNSVSFELCSQCSSNAYCKIMMDHSYVKN